MHEDPVITPRMDAFASEGMVFENAFSCSPVCTPNRAALLTGKHPFAVNMMRNWLRLPVEEKTVASVAKEHGYDTGYIGKWHLDEWDGDERFGDAWNTLTPAGPRRMGFDFWYSNGCHHAHFLRKYLTTDNRVVEGTGWQVDHETDIAIEYLRNANGDRHPGKPFCLFVSWAPPHTNHGGPRHVEGAGWQFAAPGHCEALYRERELPVRCNAQRDLFLRHAPGYFGAVTSMDENFGRLLDTLTETGLADNTIVVLSADHGEMLGSHRCMTKDVWYEESIGIPFIIRWPDRIPGGKRETMLLNTPDMMSSLLGLMECEVPTDVHGRDLSRVMLGQERGTSADAFLAFDGGSPHGMTRWDVFPDEGNRAWRGVRTERYTYAAASREQYANPARFRQPLPEGERQVLFDLDNDPYQLNPIYRGQGYDSVMEQLHGKVAAWLEGLGDPFLERDWH